ncbi:MAG: hypothetical protein PHU27_06165 [Salinivirgaceae bacterium]|nr:hypothetical protein [Salinivirgaceae bacterium]MDD4748167.1 hypothetical protein [Salinivirgaceae bacterium]MDY0280557.1 hypothetical protein [Salinivirgaceae bacterium]
MKMKFNGFLAVALAASVMSFYSCKPKVAGLDTGDFKEVKIPCTEQGYSDAMSFRASGSGTSTNMATSKDKALLSAKTRLAGLIESTIKAVTEQYTNEIDVGDKQEFEQSFEQMVRDVTKRTLVEVAITCEKSGTNSKNQWVTYLALEVSKDAIYNGVNNGIKKDQKLQLKYDQMKFKEKFDEEMEKMERQD